MTAATLPAAFPAVPANASGATIARWTIGFTAFLGAFVIHEPAPYELFLLAAMVVFLLFGLRLSAISLTLGTLFVLFNTGGMLAMFTMVEYRNIPMYLAVSLFLGLTSVFWCAVVEADMGRLRTIMRGYIIGATCTALLGIGGYFHAFPGADLFTRYGRAMGVFQDPNVFGPFLVLPAVYLIHGLLYRPLSIAPIRFVLLLIILGGLFLSFSRAAWGLMVLASTLYYVLSLVTERNNKQRIKLIVLGALGVGALALVLVTALQFDAVSNMFDQRAKVVQHYDGAEMGRFARHAVGFRWALVNPMGIGPLEFGRLLGEDAHNIWVKSLMGYGWLGFATYLTITVLTLIGGGRLLARERPWKPFLICIYVTYVGHILVGWVIDIDHWRHAYMLIGLIWGIMALESRWQSRAVLNNAAI